jgi:recombination protein RecR
LLSILNKYKFKEVTIATSWTNNGEYTAGYLKNIIRKGNDEIKIYRLAVGLPINSALDYADNVTIKHALKNKTEY